MKYLIIYNAGFGEETEIVECDTQAEADEAAYASWKEAAENNADYKAEPLTQENAENYGYEDELPETATK